MNPDAQRIAIAQLCGWKWYKLMAHGREYRVLQFFPYNSLPADMKESLASILLLWKHGEIPDYLTDLNAIHGAIKGQPIDVQWLAFSKLADITDPQIPAYMGTAAQWSEALLKAAGKWEEAA